MGVCDVPVISEVCKVAGEGAASLISAPFEWLASAMGSAASWVFQSVWDVFDQTTLIDLTDPGYIHVYSLIFGIAIFLMLAFFLFQLITSLIRHEPGALGRAVVGLGKSVLGSFMALTLTGLLLAATDQLSVGIVQATGQTMQDMGTKIALLAGGLAGIDIAAPGAGIILTIFLAGLAVTSAFVVWFSLLIRKALLLVSIVLAPFALAGQAWDVTKGWFGKWAAFVVAMILSKLVLVVTLLVAVTQTASPLAPDLASITQPIAGVVLMMVAAFAPYMSYKLISFMGADMYHLMSAEQEAKQALNRPMPVRTPMGSPSQVLGDPGNGSTAPPQPSATPADTATVDAGADAGAGAGVGAEAGAGTAAAGPAAAVIIGAQVIEGAAQAGPELGESVGGTADQDAGQAQTPPPPPPSRTTFTPDPEA